MRVVRTVVRTLIAAGLIACPLLAALGGQARAADVHPAYRTDQADSPVPALSITSVSPDFAKPGSTITVRGTLTNDTGSPLQDVLVQLETTSQDFTARSAMESYSGGGNVALLLVPEGTTYTVSGTLQPHRTVDWSASFTAAEAGYSAFGVYPLEADAATGVDGNPFAASRTLLPYWPGQGSATPLDAAWIWPLIDNPQQGACGQTLATNSLAGSLRPGGRLGTLLSTGLQLASQTHLTWAVDPALLSDAEVMTQPYKVGGDSVCRETRREPASTAAASWLAELSDGTANQPMFVTPYADVDVSALSHAGMDPELTTAYTLGESVASRLLHRPFGANGDGTGDGGIAWPADGTADEGVLSSLATSGGVSAVVLGSDEMPANGNVPDNAVAATSTAGGGTLDVLLGDSELTNVLGSASAGSSQAAQFGAEQDFLAETAMIAAEEPFQQRSLVIAPPRRWDPSAAEARTLLSMTTSANAPWLRPVGLSSLTSAKADSRALPASQVSNQELSSSYLHEVGSVSTRLALYENLLYQPNNGTLQSLNAALAVTESSAWRGPGAKAGQLALVKLSDYLRDSEQKVQIIAGKDDKVLLTGASGQTPVSVQNSLSVPVQVRVQATVPKGSQLSVGTFASLITVPGGKIRTVSMPVRSSSLGTTTMQLQLVTKDGSPLAWTSQSLSVEVTRYGRALLVVIVAALGVLVLAAVARWVRQWLNDARAGSGGTG